VDCQLLDPTTAQSAPFLIFVHIPKTGGATLRSILLRNYPRSTVYRSAPSVLPDPAEFSEQDRARIRVYEGHMPFGLHTRLSEPATYITLVRDPVERAISRYHYILERPEHPQYQKVRAYRDLKEFSCDAPNEQVMLLAGPRQRGVVASEARLEEAKENLRRHFAVVGLTEQFDETLLLLKRRFGWRYVLYRRHNVTGSRPTIDELPAETRAVLEERNQLDRELHTYARGLLEEQLERQGVGFAIELEAFRRVNASPRARRSSAVADGRARRSAGGPRIGRQAPRRLRPGATGPVGGIG
jgi:hypothetical protein